MFAPPKNKGSNVLKVHTISAPMLGSKISTVLPSGCWEGRTCFILGGGPSLEGFDYRWIEGQHTIGINKTFKTFSATLNYSMDYNFFDLVQYTTDPHKKDFELHEAWMAYQGFKVFLHHGEHDRFAQNILYVNEILQKSISFDLEKGIFPGNNSGCGALMLAVALGCKKIGLLGYDLKIQGNRTHWHEGYGHPSKDVERSLEDFRGCIDEWGPVILSLGVKVFNLSPDSALRSFPKTDVQTFLHMI